MKKFIPLLLLLALVMPLAYAEESLSSGGQGADQKFGIISTESSDLDASVASSDATVDAPVSPRERMQDRITQRTESRNMTTQEIRRDIETKKIELSKESENLSAEEQKIHENQNTVRLAVHALLDMEGRSGGIGKNVSAIAREFNNSVQSTINAEEKIQKRSAIAKFFAGGDAGSADEIEKEVSQNRERITALKQLKEECACDSETKQIMQEQITSMELEQTRLGEVAAKEKQSKGIIGWLWK